ncbi:MAG: hypothetical protein F4Y65_01990 [Gammaproteobacteria bacterium]|nr:hypothetical protein [Gammaproteobacteria bacterium]
MSYTAGEEDVFASCNWSESVFGEHTGVSATFLLTIIGYVMAKSDDVNHNYLDMVSSSNIMSINIRQHEAEELRTGVIRVTNDLRLLSQQRTIEFKSKTESISYDSERFWDVWKILTLYHKAANRDKEEYPDGYRNKITVALDLNVAIVLDNPLPLIPDEILNFSVSKRLGVNKQGCPTQDGHVIEYTIDNYYSPISGPQSLSR